MILRLVFQYIVHLIKISLPSFFYKFIDIVNPTPPVYVISDNKPAALNTSQSLPSDTSEEFGPTNITDPVLPSEAVGPNHISDPVFPPHEAGPTTLDATVSLNLS